MRHAIGYVFTAASVLLASGCANSEKLDIGEGKKPAGALGASLADYAGKWDGHAEAYEFDDGSDRIRLSINEDGTGVLEAGDSPALPAPDPDVGYPSGGELDEKGFYAGIGTHGFYSGFEYAISGAVVESKRIRFKALTRDVFREWCELQTPELDVPSGSEPSYSCAHAHNGFSMTGAPGSGDEVCTSGVDDAPVDCGRLSLCLSLCECSESECSIYDEPDSQFDAVLQAEGEELEGTLVIDGERVVVRMTRE